MGWELFKEREIKATPETVWKVLKDVDNWHVWDVDLKKATLKGPGTGELGLENAPGEVAMKWSESAKFPFRLHDVRPSSYIAYETPLPGALADWYWDWSKYDASTGTTTMKMGVKVSGLASYLYRIAIGGQTMKAFDICTGNLKELIETGKVSSTATSPK
ncbi:hypothetical protein BJ742DRAFT_737868 [Cladochytrium replicatum]|nr:hypothetical protein BJ742DRAFT_737868 [Cladochytrium replicatum]